MKVLTIRQPFASLIAEGIKEYEFRTWKTNYRGDLLIHAGLGVNESAMEKYKNYNLEYPKGCIIAKVTMTDCVKVDDNLRKILKEKNRYLYSNQINNKEDNTYVFILKDIKKIKPINNIKGKLGFWEYDYKEDIYG